MRRAWVMLATGLMCLVAALATGSGLYYTLTYFLAATLLLSFVWAWSAIRGLRLRRYTPISRTQVGRPMEERFWLRNASRLPKLWVVVRDGSDLPGYHASRVVYDLRPRQEYGWITRVLCERRGRFHLGPVTISAGDPLGLFEFRRELPQTRIVVVYPATVPVRNFPHVAGYLPGGDALRRRTHHVTPNAAGVREYVPGDSFNRIHWPSTARKDRLIVKECELDPLSDVWIFLDMERSVHFEVPVDEAELAMREEKPWWMRQEQLRLESSTEEYAVTAAASVAEFFVRRGRAVGLVTYGQRRQIIQADRDERQLNKVLDALAVLRAEGDMPFDEVLNLEGRGLARGTIVVTISPAADEEWARTALLLDQTGLRIVAILVDALSFGGPLSAAPLRERLLVAGVPAVLLRDGDPLEDVLSSLPSPRSTTVLPPAYAVPTV